MPHKAHAAIPARRAPRAPVEQGNTGLEPLVSHAGLRRADGRVVERGEALARHHVVGAAERLDAPTAHERHGGAGQERVVGVVRGHEDAQALAGEVLDGREDLHLVVVVEVGGGLVHHERLGLLRQGARHEHHLLLAARHLLVEAVGQVRHLQALKRRLHGPLVVGMMARRPREVRHAPHAHHLAGGVGEGQARVLRHVGHVQRPLLHGEARHVLPVHHHGARLGFLKAQHAAQKRRLAGAVGAQQAQDLAVVQGERHALEHLAAAGPVGVVDVGDLKHYSHSFLVRTSRNTNTGVPMSAVSTPRGRSEKQPSTRSSMSSRNRPPTTNDVAMSLG